MIILCLPEVFEIKTAQMRTFTIENYEKKGDWAISNNISISFKVINIFNKYKLYFCFSLEKMKIL